MLWVLLGGRRVEGGGRLGGPLPSSLSPHATLAAHQDHAAREHHASLGSAFSQAESWRGASWQTDSWHSLAGLDASKPRHVFGEVSWEVP